MHVMKQLVLDGLLSSERDRVLKQVQKLRGHVMMRSQRAGSDQHLKKSVWGRSQHMKDLPEEVQEEGSKETGEQVMEKAKEGATEPSAPGAEVAPDDEAEQKRTRTEEELKEAIAAMKAEAAAPATAAPPAAAAADAKAEASLVRLPITPRSSVPPPETPRTSDGAVASNTPVVGRVFGSRVLGAGEADGATRSQFTLIIPQPSALDKLKARLGLSPRAPEVEPPSARYLSKWSAEVMAEMQAKIDQLTEENARLEESLIAADANSPRSRARALRI